MSDAKRGQKPIQVTPQELETQLFLLESKQEFPNRSALWNALADTEWAKTRSPRPLTAQVAMMIAKKNEIVITTPIGERGRKKGCGPVVVKERKKRGLTQEQIQELQRMAKGKYEKQIQRYINRAAKGSLKALIQVKCIDCMAGQPNEVRLCPSTGCSSYHMRPFKGRKGMISLVTLEGNNNGTDGT